VFGARGIVSIAGEKEGRRREASRSGGVSLDGEK